MAAIVEERTIAATPERVFTALTRAEEIVNWWSSEATIKPTVGTLAAFGFKNGAVLQFEITELDTDKKVSLISRQGPPQWAGTSVTWQLTPAQNGTRAVLTHDRFAQVDEVYEKTRKNWQYFLDSLKSYLETGQGTPGLPRYV